jgi:amino acid transporter
MAYVAAEVKDARRNIVRALAVGTGAVMGLYLLANGAFLYTLGYDGLATSNAVASDAIGTVFPVVGSRLISALVCISALGAVNGLIFTGARISYAVGEDHRIFRPLGRWDPRTGTPARALAVQGLIALAMILIFGGFIEAILATAVAVYAFYLGTSLSVIVLRFKEPHVERPYRVTGYPITPLIFSGVCLLLIYSSIDYARNFKPVSLVVLGVASGLGIAVYLLTRNRNRPAAADSPL